MLLKFTADERRVVAEAFGRLEQAELAYHSTLAVVARLHGLNPIGLRLAPDGSGFVGQAGPQARMAEAPGGDGQMPDLNEGSAEAGRG
jgi:hypothetical protein